MSKAPEYKTNPFTKFTESELRALTAALDEAESQYKLAQAEVLRARSEHSAFSDALKVAKDAREISFRLFEEAISQLDAAEVRVSNYKSELDALQNLLSTADSKHSEAQAIYVNGESSNEQGACIILFQESTSMYEEYNSKYPIALSAYNESLSLRDSALKKASACSEDCKKSGKVLSEIISSSRAHYSSVEAALTKVLESKESVNEVLGMTLSHKTPSASSDYPDTHTIVENTGSTLLGTGEVEGNS